MDCLTFRVRKGMLSLVPYFLLTLPSALEWRFLSAEMYICIEFANPKVEYEWTLLFWTSSRKSFFNTASNSGNLFYSKQDASVCWKKLDAGILWWNVLMSFCFFEFITYFSLVKISKVSWWFPWAELDHLLSWSKEVQCQYINTSMCRETIFILIVCS